MEKWEYKIVSMRRLESGDLNLEGESGWELVSLHPAGDEWRATFKRLKVPASTPGLTPGLTSERETFRRRRAV